MNQRISTFLLSVLVLSLTATNLPAAEITEDTPENLISNGSFETAGKTEAAAAEWEAAGYQSAIRTQEKAFDGTFSMKMSGDGERPYGLRQLIPGAKLQGKKKLEVTACFYYENDLKGHFFPVFFIVTADGKQFWPPSRVRRNSDPKGKWFKAGATLDLTKYTSIKHVEIYTLGWKYGGKHFSGTAYIDNFEAFAE